MSKITLIPCVDTENPVESAKQYNHTGADAIGYYEEKASIETIKAIKKEILKNHTVEGVISLNKDTFYRVGTDVYKRQV